MKGLFRYANSSAFLVCSALLLLLFPGPYVHDASGQAPSTDTGVDTGSAPWPLGQLYWPMINRDIFHTGAGVPAAKGLKDPALHWSDPINSTALGSVASNIIRNIDFLDVPERKVVAIFDSNLTTLVAKDGDTGSVVWSLDVRTIYGRVTNTLLVAPALLDTDGDGRVEVLASISDGNDYRLALFEPHITLTPSGFRWSSSPQTIDRVWVSPNGTSGPLRYSSPCLHDLNSDGVEDIIIGTGNRLSAHSGTNGSQMWSLEIGPVGEVLSTPAVYPGIGPTNRVVVNSLTSSRQQMRTTVVNFQGAYLKNVTVALGSPIPHTFTGPVPAPVIGDVTGNGALEVIVSYPSLPGSGRLICYTYALDQVATIGPLPGSLESYPSVKDLDADGGAELVVQTRVFTTPPSLRMAAYKVFQNGTTRTMWVKDAPAAGTNPLYSPPMVCDLDGDGRSDLIFTGNGRLHALRWDGAFLWNITLQTIPFAASGMVGDLGNDKFTDIYIKGHKVTQAMVDLQLDGSVQPNIYAGDPDPTEGRTTDLNCLVRNSGPNTARGVKVTFSDTEPSGAVSFIGEVVMSEVVITAEATLRWTPGSAGAHTITVQIDPGNTILETDESNNNGSTVIYVAKAFPDLHISGIHFLRGDNVLAGKVHLVESDPSWIVVSVGNKGYKAVETFRLEVLVEGEMPPGGSRFTDAGPILPGGSLNVSVPWTPYPIPEGQAKRTYTIEATVDPYPGSVQESDETNNYGMNQTTVKNDSALGSYMVDGSVLDPSGAPTEGARVVATLNRTQANLVATTGSSGEFVLDLAFLDYKDADRVHFRASKGNAWGEVSRKVYSEDGRGSITIRQTEQPLMSLYLYAVDPTGGEVPPGAVSRFKFTAQNMGNLPGNVTMTRSVEGNTTIMTADVSVSPSNFYLQVGGAREVTLEVSVPSKEPPGSTISIVLTAVMVGDGSAEAQLAYDLTVKSKESLFYEMRSPTERTVDRNLGSSAKFEVYLLNQGNVVVDYNLTADEDLGMHAAYSRQVGRLEPAVSVMVEVTLTVPPNLSILTGELVLRTAGQGTLYSWSIIVRALLPDLVAVSPIGLEPPAPVLGDRIRLLALIRNTGEGSAPSFGYEIKDGDQVIGSSTVPSLGPGEEATVSDIMWEPKALGEHELVLTLDPTRTIVEVQRSNNEISRKIAFLPDLSIMNAEASKMKLNAGEQFTVLVTVSNLGNAPLTGGFRVYARSGSKDGREIGSEASSLNLGPRVSSTGTLELKLTAPDKGGELKVFLSVGPEVPSDGEGDPSDNTYELSGLTIVEEKGGVDRTVLYVASGIGLMVLLLLVGGGIYLWRRDDGTVQGTGQDASAVLSPATLPVVTVTADDNVGKDVPLKEAALDGGADDDGMVLTMDLESPEQEETIVADVLDDGESVPTEGLTDLDEDGLLPEI